MARRRWRAPFGVDGWSIDFDRHALPITNRRDTALALAEAGWDLSHLRCEFNVSIGAADLREYGLSDADLRRIAARVIMSQRPLFRSIEDSIKDAESQYAVQVTGEDFDPEVMTADEKRAICNALAARGDDVDALANHFGLTRKAGK